MLGFIHAQNNRPNDAIRAYRTTLRVLGESSLLGLQESADAHFNLAILYAACTQFYEADVHLRRAAVVVDTELTKMQNRESHFRHVVLKYFQSDQVTIGHRELSEALLFSQPF